MITYLSDQRIKVLQQVLDGNLPSTALTLEELEFIQGRIYDVAEEKKLDDAMAQGKIVFSGVANGLMN